MIHGYPGAASVAAGGTVVLHVATDSPRFRVTFYRWSDRLQPMRQSGWLAGASAAPGATGQDWQWPPYRFRIPPGWPSSVYIAHLEEPGAAPPSLAMASAAALFVVRGGRRGGMLYKLPLATYHAYNRSGDSELPPPRGAGPPGATVSLLRPGGGIGGPVRSVPGAAGAAPQGFAHWDAPCIRWLTRNGYAPEFCTDLDLHHDPGLAHRYRLMVSAGRDEFWSTGTRDAVEDFIAGGGNLACFAGKVCWWRIHLSERATAMVCHQGGPRGAIDQWWPAHGARRPEDALTGASYRHGGRCRDGPRVTTGYLVQRPDHWVFAGTGLLRGQAFGQHGCPPLAGQECDGAQLDLVERATGRVQLSAWADENGTPGHYTVLAACPLDARCPDLPARARHAAGEGVHAATMGIYTRGGTVFSAGCTDWAQVLDNGSDPQVARITRNVLNRLLLA